MINTETVFVVGAGASREVNLPVGSELTMKISKKLLISDQRFRGFSINPGISRGLQDGQRAGDYLECAKMIRDAMPLAPSIDNFLHTHRDNKRAIRLGKIAIADAILAAERASPLYVDVGNIYNKPDFGRVSNTWYVKLWHLLCVGVDLENVDQIFDHVSFVVFNYDRCIEQFLFYALKTYYRIDNLRAQSLLQKLRIFHPYGQVGVFRHGAGNIGVNFGEEVSSATLGQVSEQIQTFTERVEEKSILRSVHEEIANARKLIFIGFHYHEINMHLLTSGMRTNVKRIYGTRLGMSDSDAEIINSRLENFLMEDADINNPEAANRNGLLSRVLKINLFKGTCCEMFAEYSQSLGQ